MKPSPCKEYVRMMADFTVIHSGDIQTMYHLIQKYGVEFKPAARPSNVPKMRYKECFKNAFDLAMQTGYTYVEGIACSFFPTHHAWCVDENGNVIDPTWDSPENCHYFGIPFEWDFVMEKVESTMTYGVMCKFENPWELTFKPEDAAGMIGDWK